MITEEIVLLPLNEPTTSPGLQRITDVAGWLLDYVANWPSSDFDKSDFYDSLKNAGLWYLVGSRTAIGKHIPTMLTLSKKEREMLRDAFYNDVRFYESLDNPDYTFDFSLLPNDAREIGKAFLLLFYERLAGEGFRNGPRKRYTFTITRADVEDGYRIANKEMKHICPACLGKLEEPADKMSVKNIITKKSLVECEHFFPRSLYPPLIVHPNNLVLICKACNQYHNNDSPLHLDPLKSQEAGMIRKTFVPYKRPGLAIEQKLDEIKLGFDRNNPKKEFVTLISNSTDPLAHERAENFNRVYGLSYRWGKDVPGMYNSLRESIRVRASSRKEILNRKTIEVYLQEEFNLYYLLRYSEERAYVRSQYFQWIQQKCLDSLVEELEKEGFHM